MTIDINDPSYLIMAGDDQTNMDAVGGADCWQDALSFAGGLFGSHEYVHIAIYDMNNDQIVWIDGQTLVDSPVSNVSVN